MNTNVIELNANVKYMNKVNMLRHRLLSIKSNRTSVKLLQALSDDNHDLPFFENAFRHLGIKV